MDISASLGKCHLLCQQVPRRSSLSSESYSKVRFSGAHLFFWVMLVPLLLTWPWSPRCVGAATFASNTSTSPPLVCPLEPSEHTEQTRLSELPSVVQSCVCGPGISPQETNVAATTHSTFDSHFQVFEMEISASVHPGQDFHGGSTCSEMCDFVSLRRNLKKRCYSEKSTSAVSTETLWEVSPPVEGNVVDIHRPSVLDVLGDEQAPLFEFDGREICEVPVTVLAFNLDYRFLFNATGDTLLPGQAYRPSSGHFHHVDEESHPSRDLGKIALVILITFSSVGFALTLFPLLSDQRSLFFLFSLFALVPYLLTLAKINPFSFYSFRSFFCPVCVRIFGYHRLYKSRSPFRWCDEFRKKRIVDPTHFWIDEGYANTFPDRTGCYDVCEFLELQATPPRDRSFTAKCQGWPPAVPAQYQRQHGCTLRVNFDSVKEIEGVNCYTNVRLSFLDDGLLLDTCNWAAIEVGKLHLVEKLFLCFSDPSFGGYVEKIRTSGCFSTTFVAHCPRFIDFCQALFCSNPIPRFLVASRLPGSKFVVGVPFSSSELS